MNKLFGVEYNPLDDYDEITLNNEESQEDLYQVNDIFNSIDATENDLNDEHFFLLKKESYGYSRLPGGASSKVKSSKTESRAVKITVSNTSKSKGPKRPKYNTRKKYKYTSENGSSKAQCARGIDHRRNRSSSVCSLGCMQCIQAIKTELNRRKSTGATSPKGQSRICERIWRQTFAKVQLSEKTKEQLRAMMDVGGAYGGGKAGAAFDPITFVQRPQVILRAVNWLFAVIIFGCISSQGWLTDPETKKEVCLYNGDANACNYGVGISVIAFLAAMAFIAGEYFFEQMSSVKTRKHYVLGDLGFSASWAFLYFVGFIYLANQWGKAETPPMDYGVNNCRSAILFSFFAIFSWGASAFFAYQRFKQGAEAAFTAGFQDGAGRAPYDTNTFDQAYQEPPFSQSHIAVSEGQFVPSNCDCSDFVYMNIDPTTEQYQEARAYFQFQQTH